MARLSAKLLVPLVIASSATLVGVVPANAMPGNIPDAATAKSWLGGLSVAADGSMTGYSRDKFKHWIDQGNSCNTRELVLKRDGKGVTTGSDCYPTAGSWYSEYDDTTTSDPSTVQIDHVVPLADAWRTGASSWTDAKRQDYANDLDAPQLLAVSGSSNESKGDKSPDQWKPPRTAFHCTYAEMWVAVKHKYALTVNSAEKSALTTMLGSC